MKQKEAEMLETLPPDLKPYYKEKVSEYFNNLGNDKFNSDGNGQPNGAKRN